jgi:uncharacterized protein (DUF2236 family)
MNASEEKIAEAIGYFGPNSATWQIYREPIILLGGVRALLLQVAHPAVADGVARFSNFKSDPFGRGYRTFAAMAMIYFGSKTQAEQTAQRLWRIHSAIRGEAPEPYSANRPDLLLWVLATLTDTTLRVYERVPSLRLTPDWPERFYEESKVAARLLGIPDEVYPLDLEAFETYFKTMLTSDVLGSMDTCQEVAQAIVQHPRVPKKLANLLAAGWLPAPLCKRLGIAVATNSELKLDQWVGRVVWIYRLIPKNLRWNPAYHQAQFRIEKAQGRSPAWAGRFFNGLAKRIKVPLGLEA